MAFDRKGEFSVGNRFGRNWIIFAVDMSSSVHVDKKKKDILILDEGHTQELDGTTLTAEKKIQSILTEIIKKFVYVCIIMEQTVIYLLVLQKFISLKQKIRKL